MPIIYDDTAANNNDAVILSTTHCRRHLHGYSLTSMTHCASLQSRLLPLINAVKLPAVVDAFLQSAWRQCKA